MIATKLERFKQSYVYFLCPLCQGDLTMAGTSLLCPKKHCFDMAKFGYVNLAPQIKQSKDYDKTSFENRQLILEAGFYQHILEKIEEILTDAPAPARILDVACGEGYYSRQLKATLPDKDFYAFDISKPSIQLAAKADKSLAVNWFVGDLAHIPLKSQSMDRILDIFSPANYQEFSRLLAPNGRLIKVIPTSQHLVEIREKVGKTDYSNEDIKEHFMASFELEGSQTVSATYALQPTEKEALLAMTPLLFHENSQDFDWADLTSITISAEILVGRPKT